jgi:hypothetical protein
MHLSISGGDTETQRAGVISVVLREGVEAEVVGCRTQEGCPRPDGKVRGELRSWRSKQCRVRRCAGCELQRRDGQCSVARYSEQAHANQDDSKDDKHEARNGMAKVPIRRFRRSGDYGSGWAVCCLTVWLTRCRWPSRAGGSKTLFVPVLLLCTWLETIAHRLSEYCVLWKCPGVWRLSAPLRASRLRQRHSPDRSRIPLSATLGSGFEHQKNSN